MAKRVLAVLLLATFAVASFAQFDCDQARGLGNPSSNQCSRLCTIVAQRTPSLARLVPYCNTQCGACVRDVYKCKLGAKQALPATCQAATKFPQVLSVINECLALRTQGKAC